MREEFINKLGSCENDRNKLIALLAEIDSEKGSLKSRLTQLSSEPNGEFGRGRKRQEQIRRITDKNKFLNEEREVIRNKLGRIKQDLKLLNKSTNSRSVNFSQAFIAAAEILLSEEQFNEIEVKASEMLAIK